MDSSDSFLGWLAGIVEGEGHLQCYRCPTGFALRLRVTNTDTQILQACQDGTGAGDIRFRKRQNWALCGDWVVTGRRAQWIICMLLPYFRGRRRSDAELFVAFPILGQGGRPAHRGGWWHGPFVAITRAIIYQALRGRRSQQ